MIGSQIGKYRVVSLLGEGGMGAVYKAIHDGLDRWVAIKVLHSKFASRSDMMSRFQNEARAANLVKHPSLVEIYDTDRLPDGSIYLVMELLDGEALDALIERRQKRLPLKRALRIAWQLADAMAAVHGKNIVHRDLKPSNVMLVRDSLVPGGERIKLLDFGIAKLAVENLKGHAKTATGTMLGTVFYVAPEQCQNAGSVDGKADVYSLGAMLYELLTGQLPFDGENEIQIILHHLQTAPPKAAALAPDVPPELSDLIERMLAKDRAARPPMAEVAASLQRIDAALNLPEPPADDPPRPKMEDLPTAPLTIPQSSPQEALAFTGVRVVKDSAELAALQPPDKTRARSLSGMATDPSGEGFPRQSADGDEAGGRGRAAIVPWLVAGVGGLALFAGLVFYVRNRPQSPSLTPDLSAVSAPAIPAPPQRRWVVHSTPPDAEVVDTTSGRVLGRTPFEKTGPAPSGPQPIALRKTGYVDERVELPADRDFSDSIVLKPLPPPPSPAPSAKPGKPKRKPEKPAAAPPAAPSPAPAATPAPVATPNIAVPRVTPPRLVAPDKKP